MGPDAGRNPRAVGDVALTARRRMCVHMLAPAAAQHRLASSLGRRPPAIRTLAVVGLALGLAWGRVLAARRPEVALASLVAGGAALTALGLGFTSRELGLSRRRLALRLLAGLVLGAVLVLPTAARRSPVPVLPPPFALAAIAVSVGEEVAFRGALFAAVERWLGPVPAILGSSLVFAAGHLLSHPPEFLLAVTAAGLLLAAWRWACHDLMAPIVAHCIADLAL